MATLTISFTRSTTLSNGSWTYTAKIIFRASDTSFTGKRQICTSTSSLGPWSPITNTIKQGRASDYIENSDTTFSLKPGESYTLWAKVQYATEIKDKDGKGTGQYGQWIDSSDSNLKKSNSVTAPYPKPVINSVTVAGTRGAKTLTVTWLGSSIYDAAKWTVQAKKNGTTQWYDKTTDLRFDVTSTTITVDNYGYYDVKVSVTQGDQSASKEANNNKVQPALFDWTAGKSFTKGLKVSDNLLASDWNRLQQNINDVREYNSVGTYTFNHAAGEGNEIMASYYNDMVSALAGLGVVVSKVNGKSDVNGTTIKEATKITDTVLTALKTGVNSKNT